MSPKEKAARDLLLDVIARSALRRLREKQQKLAEAQKLLPQRPAA